MNTTIDGAMRGRPAGNFERDVDGSTATAIERLELEDIVARQHGSRRSATLAQAAVILVLVGFFVLLALAP